MRERRELLCERCDREYPVWSATNPLWNAVIRDHGGDGYGEDSDRDFFLCPLCFALLAEERGVATGLTLTNETDGFDAANHLAYVVREIAIEAAEAHEVYRLGVLAQGEETPVSGVSFYGEDSGSGETPAGGTATGLSPSRPSAVATDSPRASQGTAPQSHSEELVAPLPPEEPASK